MAHPHLAGAVVAARSSRLGYFSQQLAQRTGAILPVISAEYYDTLIKRVLTEKTISIDTTASGGNTSLMTLVEDDEQRFSRYKKRALISALFATYMAKSLLALKNCYLV